MIRKIMKTINIKCRITIMVRFLFDLYVRMFSQDQQTTMFIGGISSKKLNILEHFLMYKYK